MRAARRRENDRTKIFNNCSALHARSAPGRSDGSLIHHPRRRSYQQCGVSSAPCARSRSARPAAKSLQNASSVQCCGCFPVYGMGFLCVAWAVHTSRIQMCAFLRKTRWIMGSHQYTRACAEVLESPRWCNASSGSRGECQVHTGMCAHACMHVIA